jgi:tRNA (cmo5U34)-methyltransferase
MTARDQLFANPTDLVDFRFDDDVAGVFPDMIRRSVPGYELVLTLGALLAARHVPAGGLCVDLGCSLGAGSFALRHAIGVSGVRIIGVDNAPAMIEGAQALLAARPRALPDGADIEFRCADLREVDCTGAHAIVMNFTLQFIAPAERLPLLQHLRSQLAPGGVLLYAEKLAATAGSDVSRWDEAAHLDFKRANGYSELEIAQKRAALEHVLRPDTRAEHEARLRAAGFGWQHCWLHCLNWAAFAACVEPPTDADGWGAA